MKQGVRPVVLVVVLAALISGCAMGGTATYSHPKADASAAAGIEAPTGGYDFILAGSSEESKHIQPAAAHH